MRSYSFRRRQFLILAVLAITSVTIFLAIFLRLSRTYSTQRMADQMNTVAALKTNQVQGWLDQGRAVAKLISTDTAVIEYLPSLLLPQSVEADAIAAVMIDAELMRIYTVYPYVTSVSLLSPDEGHVFFSSDPSLLNRVRKNDAYFQAGRDAITVSQVKYSVADEAPILMISAPVRDKDGNLMAVAAIEMALKDLEVIINHPIGPSQIAKVYLVDAYGFYVTLPPGVQGGPLSTIAKSEGVQRAVSGVSGSDTYMDPQGVRVLGTYTWLPEPGLGLLVEVNEVELNRQTKQAQFAIILLCVFVLVLVIVASSILTQWLVKPLENIVTVARAIQAGEYNVQALVKGPDEIGQLAAAINEMAQSIQVSHMELESLVDARTVELTKSESRYRAVIEAQPDIIYRYLYDGTITFANQAFCEFFGKAFDEVIGTDHLDYVPLDVHADVREQVVRLSAQTPLSTNENENYDRDGVPHWFHWTNQAVIDQDGGIIEYQAVGRDITDRKKAEEKLMFQASLLEQVENAVFTFDFDNTILSWNHHAEALFQWTAEEAIGQNIVTLLEPKEVKSTTYRDYEKTNRYGHWEAEYDVRRKDGSVIPVHVTNTHLKDMSGNNIGYIGISYDVIERKKAELALMEYSERLEEMVEERTRDLAEAQERLVSQEKLAVMGKLAGGVAHELRNPLGVITNTVYLLNLVLPNIDAQAQEWLDLIDTEAKNAAKIVSDLLDFARIRTSNCQPTPVSALIAASLEKNPAPEGIAVDVQVPSDLPPVWIDPQQMVLVINNLMTNAYYAMPDGGKLTLTCEQHADSSGESHAGLPENEHWVSIRVCDTGTGIKPENMVKLFEPLFTTKIKGIGLGLATSKNLVEANGGRIEVESQWGKGAVFTVYLPVSPLPGS